MLHGAGKGFIESGKYGKPGKYFLGFLNLFLYLKCKGEYLWVWK